MCGIAGIVGVQNDANRASLQRMASAMVHRGPDAGGFWEAVPDAQGWGPMLAHRRLAILDLSPSGAQPMVDALSGDTLVQNGEIYNYQELRAQLAALGHVVDSSGDAAVMLRALSVHGTRAMASMRGMFAVAFWSVARRELVLARDALGMKPLYIARNPDPQGNWSLAFASELRALLASGLLAQHRLNPAAVSSVVWSGYTVAPETAVQGIASLWPGEQRIYNARGGELSRQRHWQLPAAASQSGLTEAELAQELDNTVKLHLASDVPLGVFLSGGVDSSALANLAQKASREQVHTFTMAFEEQERNEGEFSKRIAKAIGTSHQEFLLTESYFMAHLDAALDSLDQPSFDGLNSYFMSHAVKDAGFKVALVGSGGDELFGGYTTFRDLPLLHRCARLLRCVPNALVAGAASAVLAMARGKGAPFPPQTRWSKLPDMVRCKDDLLALYQLAYALFLPAFQSELLAAPAGAMAHGLPESTLQQLLQETQGRSTLQAISVLEQRLFLGERLLRDTDAVSMSASIEIRLPLVDQHLLTQVNRVPDDLRYQPIRRKALLRRIGLRGLAPELFDRPKSGFELPYDRWMRSRLGQTIGDTFNDRTAVQAAGLNPAAVLRLWNAFLANTPGLYWSRIWSLYVLVRWCSRHGVTIRVAPMHSQISYLINQYPKVSHSFIRREILALEAQGVRVHRIALRGWNDPVVDPQDEAERAKTRYVLQHGVRGLLLALLASALSRPLAFGRALALAARLGWRADRPWAYHFIYLAEACVIGRWMKGADSRHLHAHFGTNPAMVCLLVQALFGNSYSFTVHGPEEFDKPGTLRLREKVQGASFVAAISSFGRSQLYRWADQADWSKIQIVHCGLDARYLAQPPVVAAEPGRLVCIGRLCEQKGQLLLLQALKIVVDTHCPVKLVLAGDGEMRPQIEESIARLGLGPHVEITGWISGDEVEQQLLRARAMVLPSFAEGLPVVIMEAMAMARPVITTYVAGIPELVRQGESGWLVPASDVQALAEVMLACLNATDAELRRMGQCGRERVLLRHNVDTEAAKLVLLLSSV